MILSFHLSYTMKSLEAYDKLWTCSKFDSLRQIWWKIDKGPSLLVWPVPSDRVYSTDILSEVDIRLSFHLSYTMKSLEPYDKLWTCSKFDSHRQIRWKIDKGPSSLVWLVPSDRVYSTAILSEVDIHLMFHLSYTMKSLEAYDKLWTCSKFVSRPHIWWKIDQGQSSLVWLVPSDRVYSTAILSEVDICLSLHLRYTMKSLEAYDKLWTCSKFDAHRQIGWKIDLGPSSLVWLVLFHWVYSTAI